MGTPLTPAAAELLTVNVEAAAVDLAEALKQAVDSGVSAAILLPRLVVVFREAGLFSGDVSSLPGIGPMLSGGN